MQHPGVQFLKTLSDDTIDTLIKKLKMGVKIFEAFKFAPPTHSANIAIRSIGAAIISLSAAVLDALEKKRIFVACSLCSQITESEIQLRWLDKHFDARGADYMDFGYVEQISMLRMHPERKEAVLQMLKEHNCRRFFCKNPKDDNLLNPKNYVKNWYGDTIKNISEDCLQDLLEEIKDIPEMLEYYNNSDPHYENYQVFCGFKHISSYCVRKCFATESSFVEDTPEDTARVVLILTIQALISLGVIMGRHGDQVLNMKPVETYDLVPASKQQSQPNTKQPGI